MLGFSIKLAHSLSNGMSGKVVEVRQHDQYVIKVDGSGRVTLRNRKFLCRFLLFLQHTTSSTLPHRYGRPATHVHIPHVNDPSIQPEETTSSPHRVTRPSQIPIISTILEKISDDQNPQCLTTPIPQLPPEDLPPQSKASEPIISKKHWGKGDKQLLYILLFYCRYKH